MESLVIYIYGREATYTNQFVRPSKMAVSFPSAYIEANNLQHVIIYFFIQKAFNSVLLHFPSPTVPCRYHDELSTYVREKSNPYFIFSGDLSLSPHPKLGKANRPVFSGINLPFSPWNTSTPKANGAPRNSF